MAADQKIEKGTISIHTENIFPIIKKWLYSDHEIFLRELVSNAVDAIHKLQHINVIEGLKLTDEYAIDISVDKTAGTLSVKDNGIGMTADEIRQYINQIAFSSAEEFVQKFKDLEDKNQIIGHFGLGFYSSFMVADQVEIRSLSYQKEAKGAHWSCDGSTTYTLEECDKAERGTEIILHLNEDSKEFLEPARLRDILKKYCNFLPVAIRLEGEVANDQNPLWTRAASEIKDEEYVEFYRKLYPFSDDPLFWIHLNIDFPFHLKGILYFPRITTEFDISKSHIKLFCNQVFVSDNCPELLPEFLTPLQGCLDAPDLPLNVSRSYLQNEPQVRKIREVISGRMASKVVDLAKKDREAFGKVWDDIHTFVKYGMMRDDKFSDKVKDQVLFRTTAEMKYTTLPEYLERNKERHESKVFYANDEAAQATYLKLFKSQGLEALILDALIDSHFIQFLEMKNQGVSFERVDADVTQNLIEHDQGGKIVEGTDQKTADEKIKAAFSELLGEKKGMSVRVESLKDPSVPAMLLLAEHSRRFKEMTRMMGKEMGDALDEFTLLVNFANPVVKKIRHMKDEGRADDARLLAEQVYDLAMLTHKSFNKEQMEAFLERSNRILEMVGKG
ncbi:molecular chaperone HtpG [Geoalkalibacter ferrihydriticus]|uniref:Chaperone protein HtpG n=2 Tax=Geoalkalibacter ferrihydriticus TaxID=392333 RepID=A0A0C2DQY1_9BACT|nr:molecular chaperone HtpG [Geoalkalibacter ferrihydriticus]KIH75844.1 molecular chaperone Hsp90 [Geoalkalibacter ferrihydriticus DSM 17813]SDM67739.1 molecular chaperone HtpG [Geoalkalibacter ferrihydriticus]